MNRRLLLIWMLVGVPLVAGIGTFAAYELFGAPRIKVAGTITSVLVLALLASGVVSCFMLVRSHVLYRLFAAGAYLIGMFYFVAVVVIVIAASVSGATLH
jgi:hypothetical protein